MQNFCQFVPAGAQFADARAHDRRPARLFFDPGLEIGDPRLCGDLVGECLRQALCQIFQPVGCIDAEVFEAGRRRLPVEFRAQFLRAGRRRGQRFAEGKRGRLGRFAVLYLRSRVLQLFDDAGAEFFVDILERLDRLDRVRDRLRTDIAGLGDVRYHKFLRGCRCCQEE